MSIISSLLPIQILIILSGVFSGFLAWRFSQPHSRFFVADFPNERSLHTSPIPRTGGIAIMVSTLVSGTVATLFYVPPNDILWLLGGCISVAAVSFFDDRYGLAPRYRLMVHLIAATLLIFGGFRLTDIELSENELEWLSHFGWVLSLLYIVWMINLYNFMDGMDGFSAGMAVMGFSLFGFLGWQADNNYFAVLSLIIAASTFGFLVWNFPPARIFMGDTGSSTLGYLVAAFSLWAHREGIFSIWIAVIIFSPFIVDATATLIRRLLHGEKVWEAHKSHYYQRLVRLGWGHKRTVLREYILMFLCSVSALLASLLPAVYLWVIIAGWTMLYIILIVLVHQLEARHRTTR